MLVAASVASVAAVAFGAAAIAIVLGLWGRVGVGLIGVRGLSFVIISPFVRVLLLITGGPQSWV